jgi:hypothetical protein
LGRKRIEQATPQKRTAKDDNFSLHLVVRMHLNGSDLG